MALKSRGWDLSVERARNKQKSMKRTFAEGFLTNALNPKATLFFLALFTQVISPLTPISWQVIFGVSISMMVGFWFTIVSLVLTQVKIRAAISRFSIWIDRLTGVMFIGLGLKIATEKMQ
jgi:threonine/homoserine/homoserine lactone efflux protein